MLESVHYSHSVVVSLLLDTYILPLVHIPSYSGVRVANVHWVIMPHYFVALHLFLCTLIAPSNEDITITCSC